MSAAMRLAVCLSVMATLAGCSADEVDQKITRGLTMTNDEFDKLLTEQARPTMEELARQSQELRMGYEVAADAGGWKSIDTAPKDGTTILAWDGYAVIVRWSYDAWRDDFQSYLALTHWMPLPTPPQAANPSDQEIRDAINGDI